MINIDNLKREAFSLGMEVSPKQCEMFDAYASLLAEWNQKINLTAITDPDGMVTKHFADSLTLLAANDMKEGSRLIDVGSGAGFPGLPAKIMRPDINITLLDSTNKRINFLNTVAKELGLDISAVHGRAEELANTPEHREKYDYATARAVAQLNQLCEYCLGFVKVGGSFISLKGPSAAQEGESAKNAISKMGGKLSEIVPYNLADGSQRMVVIIKKISQTPTNYPRHGSKISKKPL